MAKKKQVTVRLREGARFKTEPEVIADELRRLYERSGGVLVARAVWQANQDEDAPLHAEFTWDDAEAGALYRDDQARRLLRAVEIVRDDKPAPGFVHVEIGGTSGYMPTEKALANEVTRVQVLREAVQHLSAARRRLSSLEGMASATGAIDGVIESLAKAS